MSAWVLVLGALAVAAANGANDNFKGVATIFGSRTASYRTSLIWATLTTLAGGLAATVLGARLAAAFSGGGLLPPELVGLPTLLMGVAISTALTVGLAARIGIPISTTHAILGALIGAGAMASAGQLHMSGLAQRFVAPLLLSPILSFALVAVLYPLLSRLRVAMGVEPTTCVCVATHEEAMAPTRATLAFTAAPAIVHTCDASSKSTVLGVSARQLVSMAHFLSAGLQSFARGLNDTPKIAALMFGATLAGVTLPPTVTFIAVAATMMLGGWFGARRVGETMSLNITPLNEGQALTTNAITASVVLSASVFALPVSMTHVGVGGLIGIGWSTGEAHWKMIRTILLSWVVTLPLAAVLGALTFAIVARILP